MKRIEIWLDKENQAFSRMAGEKFKNYEVVMAFIGTITVIAGCALAEWLEGLA
nr:hypothetical protein [uncultured Prevotella sp.]